MLIKNSKYGFSFVVPDDYNEIPKEKYREYNIDSSTLHVFVKLKDGEPYTISLNRDDSAENEQEYLELVDCNAKNMETLGMKIDERAFKTDGRARVDTFYSSFRGLRFATRFTVIRGIMVACSVEIKEKGDEQDRILAALYDSIEEI